MKMVKKLLAVVLAGVLALSVLTGCGNAASTKTIADVLSDMAKLEEVEFKADSKLNEKARLIAEMLSKYEDEEETLAATLEEDKEEGPGFDEEEEINAQIMKIMGAEYAYKYVWYGITPTKGYNVTAQAYNLLEDANSNGNINSAVGWDKGTTPANVRYIGTATITVDGEGYRVAVITAGAEEVKKPENNKNEEIDGEEK